jgi:hypothetical protein
MSFSKIYDAYIKKAQRKGYAESHVKTIITWLTGYQLDVLGSLFESDITVRDFFQKAPSMNPNRYLITGIICGIRVENIEDELMKNIRYLDKLIDELAKHKPMSKILRK